MSEIYYTKEHEWLDLVGNVATVGITDYAQRQLGDIVFVELPELGVEFSKDSEIAVIESVKTASEVYAPISGKVLEVNDKIEESPEIINNSPFQEGWLFKIEVMNPEEIQSLIVKSEYDLFVNNIEI